MVRRLSVVTIIVCAFVSLLSVYLGCSRSPTQPSSPGSATGVEALRQEGYQGEFCVYVVVTDFNGLTPPLVAGDTLCVDCPKSGTCPHGRDFAAHITDREGNTQRGRIGRASPDNKCEGCPANGKQGYRFKNR
jgi:hypothetical protein